MNPHRRHPLIFSSAMLVYVFLYAPILVLILFSFNASRANITFEGFIPAFSDRVVMDGSLVKSSPYGPFHWFCELSKNKDVAEAAGNTLTIAFISTIISTILGTMAALSLQRYKFKLKPFSQLSLYIPIVIPEIVMGIGILTLFIDTELPDLVLQGIEIWKIPPDKVMIELTESAIMEDQPRSLETLHELKKLGLKLAMDDFGTGFSSMERLLNLPLDEIKIDMMFVKDMLTSPIHERIVDSMINLGHQLNLIVVAEGVEDAQTYERLKQLGCDVIQGYFIGRPVPLTELIQQVTNK